jgi:UDP-glucuronate 4-epimerase
MTRFLVTGAAGFIGFHLSRRLLQRGDEVFGIDNLNDYYEVRLKEARREILLKSSRFRFEQVDISTGAPLMEAVKTYRPDVVVNLAAQAGVRYSLENPNTYLQSNIVGFGNILEACRHFDVKHLVYASSSSVYGSNGSMPFSTHDNVDHPLSLYAASKKSNELMAHTYSHLYGLPTTGLRFFTVYGPWGRPDMALFLFTKAILGGEPINVFNNGQMRRDFTYIDDIVEGLVRVCDRPAPPNRSWSPTSPDPASSSAPYRVYNIGNGQPVDLMKFIELLEQELGRKAILTFLPMQPGDVQATAADIDDLSTDFGFRPSVSVDKGIPRFVEWYLEYYGDLRSAHPALIGA